MSFDIGRISIAIRIVLLKKYDFLQLLTKFDEVLAALADVAYALSPLLGRSVFLDLQG